MSQIFDQGRGDTTKKARNSRLKILSPIGLSRRVPDGKAGGPPLALVEDALGLEEQGLAESLGADDDELVVPVRTQKAVDLGRAVEQGLVEVLCHPDVVRVHGPCAHTFSPVYAAKLVFQLPTLAHCHCERSEAISGHLGTTIEIAASPRSSQ